MRPAGKPGSRAGRLGFGSTHKSGTQTERRKVGSSRKIAVGPVRQNKAVRKRGKIANNKMISSMKK